MHRTFNCNEVLVSEMNDFHYVRIEIKGFERVEYRGMSSACGVKRQLKPVQWSLSRTC